MIFVTGGTGLVGSHILMRLTLENKKFKAVKRSTSSTSICKKVFKFYNLHDKFLKINWVEGDINDIPFLEEEISGCNLIIHAAAMVSYNPREMNIMNKVNIEGTANIVNVALDSNIKKIAYISSIATLSREKKSKIINESNYFENTGSESNYAISKYYAEQEVWRASAEGIDVVIINPSVILGPGDWSKGSSQLFAKSYNGLNFFTEGITGFVDVLDVSKITIELLFSEIVNERFIVSCENISYKHFFEKLAIEFGRKVPKFKANKFLSEVIWRIEMIRCFFTKNNPLITRETAISSRRKSYYSNEKVKNTLNYNFIKINSSIKKYCQFFIDDLS
tara:strand:- start:708 stop:1712 length:1005 start_codon:yes stop_codon:yes gene_type:complete